MSVVGSCCWIFLVPSLVLLVMLPSLDSLCNVLEVFCFARRLDAEGDPDGEADSDANEEEHNQPLKDTRGQTQTVMDGFLDKKGEGLCEEEGEFDENP